MVSVPSRRPAELSGGAEYSRPRGSGDSPEYPHIFFDAARQEEAADRLRDLEIRWRIERWRIRDSHDDILEVLSLSVPIICKYLRRRYAVAQGSEDLPCVVRQHTLAAARKYRTDSPVPFITFATRVCANQAENMTQPLGRYGITGVPASRHYGEEGVSAGTMGDAGWDNFYEHHASPDPAELKTFEIAVLQVLARMDERMRLAFLKYQWEGKGYEAIAREMGMSLGGVYKLVQKARKVLAQEFTPG
jgi:RNA polymerase sigma factor (sigma-70 family)